MSEQEVKGFIEQLDSGGWLQASDDDVMQELARHMRSVVPETESMGVRANWLGTAQELVSKVIEKVRGQAKKWLILDERTAVQGLTVLIIEQCVELIKQVLVGGPVNTQVIIIAAAYIAILVYRELSSSESPEPVPDET